MATEKQSETTKNLPYFKFYPTDFLLGIAYMTNAEIGAYIKLLCYQWNKGYLPNDHNILQALSGGMTDNVLDKFSLVDGVYKNLRLEKEREVYIDKCNKNKENVNKRYQKDTTVVRPYYERTTKHTTKTIPSQKSEYRIQNTEVISQNTEEEILTYFNTVLKKNYSLTKERIAVIKKALKQKDIIEIKIAIDNFSKDDWKDRAKFIDLQYAIGTVRGINNLDKWLAFKKEESVFDKLRRERNSINVEAQRID